MREAEAELIDAWDGGDEDNPLTGMLRRALLIGVSWDFDYWFLDPGDRADGEWAAYTWHPRDGFDPERYDSLTAMLNDERAILEWLRALEGPPIRTAPRTCAPRAVAWPWPVM